MGNIIVFVVYIGIDAKIVQPDWRMKHIDRLHIFTSGFVLIFLLDVWLSSGMVSIGMIPIAFLLSAVTTFIWLALRMANRSMADSKVRLLTRWWMVFLAVITIELLLYNGYSYFRESLPFLDKNEAIESIDDHLIIIEIYMLRALSIYSMATAILTMSLKVSSRSHRWLCFTAWAFFFSFLVPLVWDPMPNLVYRYGGFFTLPVLYGLIMIALTAIHERYRLPAGEAAVPGGSP
jgi:hypothetical protein